MQNTNNKILTVTNIIIFINIIMFMIQNNIKNGDLLFGLNIFFFKYELYYQLISTMFVHGGLAHISMNMFVLFQFGNMIEQYIGKFKFFLLYFIGGILTSIGSLLYMYLTTNWVNLIGASGAISVIMGWYALKDTYQRKGIVVWILLISFAPLLLGLPIAWYSHLIGFVIGWLIAYVL